MNVVNRKISLKSRFALAAAVALASSAGLAVPTPPPGSVLVQDFYADANHTLAVGAATYGTCPQGPSPTGWGKQSKYYAYRIYTCPGTVQRIPKP